MRHKNNHQPSYCWRVVILGVGLLFGLLAEAWAGTRIALVIGNSAYQNIRSLPNPRNDAQAVAGILKGLGFILIGPKDGVYYDLTEAEFLAARNELERRALGAEIVLVYYAGHGMQGKNGPYLLPVDVPKITQRADLELVTRRSIDLQETLQVLDGKAGLVVAVFDACREIAEFRAAGLDGMRGMERVRGYGRNRIIAYSAASGQVVPDGSGKHSPYTEKLLASLGQPGLEVADLFRKVSYEVGQQYDQQPEVLIQGVPLATYYLAQGTPSPPVAPVASTPSPPPAAPPPPVAPTLISGRYRDNGDGTVTDTKTNLHWMRCALGQTWKNGSCTGEAAKYEWQKALDAAKAFSYAGYRDWRVPSLGELRSLVYCSSGRYEIYDEASRASSCQGNYSSPTIDTAAFSSTPTRSYFWSASPIDGHADSVWSVHFSNGNGYWSNRGLVYHVRLVRAGQ